MFTAVLTGKIASLIPSSDGRAIIVATSVDALLTEANLGQVASQIGPTLDPELCSVYFCNAMSWSYYFQHSLLRCRSIVSISFQDKKRCCYHTVIWLISCRYARITIRLRRVGQRKRLARTHVVIPTQFEERVKVSIGEREKSHEKAQGSDTGRVVGLRYRRCKQVTTAARTRSARYIRLCCLLKSMCTLPVSSPMSQLLFSPISPKPISLYSALF